MATKTRCFATVKALKRLNPELLCATLRKFPEYLKERGLKLPRVINDDNMPYEEIRTACMSGGIPPELDDLLFLVCALGTTDGWERIKAEARFQELNLDFKTAGFTSADLVMKAWLHDWPRNRQLLELSYARAKIHSRSSYVYYVPMHDVRANYRTPTSAAIDQLRESLSAYFIAQGMGRGTNVMKYDFEKEIWFLVRYPGQIERYAAISDTGEPTSYVFKPEEYDAIVYHKEFGDLRLNTNRKAEHTRYRIDFSRMLLNEHNVFDPKYKAINLDPLLGDCASLFHCKDVAGLAEIVPVELRYASITYPDLTITLKASGDSHLLIYDISSRNMMGDPGAHSVQSAKFRYRCTNSTRYHSLTVHTGRVLTYERDGDSSVLEEWLRSRCFITSRLDSPTHVERAIPSN